MKKIQKKWMLFTMASVVSFVGIANTLIKDIKMLANEDDSSDLVENVYKYVYVLDKKGDVTGNGILDRDDIKVISNHVLGNVLITSEKVFAIADYNDDGNIDINDIVKLRMDIEGTGEVNE